MFADDAKYERFTTNATPPSTAVSIAAHCRRYCVVGGAALRMRASQLYPVSEAVTPAETLWVVASLSSA